MAEKYRVMTRGDLDGVVSAALLKSQGLVSEITFAEPNEVQSGKLPVTDKDILANLPYMPSAHLAFDHHASEVERLGQKPANLVLDPAASSAARVIWAHYGGKGAFPRVPQELMESVDAADAAQYTEFEEVFEPTGWVLLGYILDPRTGLDELKFKTSPDDLRRKLVDMVLVKSPDDILKQSDVKERVERYFEEEAKAREQVKRNATVHGNLVVVDFRTETTIHPVNRFVIYTMYPKQNISMTVTSEPATSRTVFAVGRSILNPTSKTHVGNLMLQYGGGGHAGAGTCRVANDQAERVMGELVARITADG